MWRALLVLSRHWVVHKLLSHRGFELLSGGLGYRAIELQSTLHHKLSLSTWTAVVSKLFIRVGINVNAQTHLIGVPCWWRMFASVIGSPSPIDKLIICQDLRERCSSLHHLENASTRPLPLPLGSLLEGLGSYVQPARPIYFSHTTL